MTTPYHSLFLNNMRNLLAHVAQPKRGITHKNMRAPLEQLGPN
jgi:hypothetical protein